jgi:hypothetical protein
MKRTTCLACIAVSAVALFVAPSFAQAKTVKACQEEWQANKAANQAAGVTEKDYVAKCRAGVSAATPVAAPMTTAKKPADPQEAEHARERACAADWKAAKTSGRVAAGMTWPTYWSECDKRKKAAGM